MNPQNNQIPQGQPAPQGYGSNAENRAMFASQPSAQPIPQPVNTQAPQPALQPSLNNPMVLQQTQPQPYPQSPAQPVTPAFAQGNTNLQAVAQSNFNQVAAGPIINPAATQPAAPQPPVEAPKIVENPLSSQATLLFSELRDSLVIMKDGSFRAVVACQSINFDLMSDTEREGVEYSYQNFLNSLNFTVQILVRSQKVDIGPYIDKLVKLRRNNDNMLLGVLMDDYINFIDILSQEANIMDKSFFVVIPYYGSADLEQTVQQTKNFFKALGKNKTPSVTRINRDTYNKAIDELNNRVESVISGLFQIGIQSVRLNTKELSELFYNFNNPDTAVREPLVDFTKVATTYVKKGERK